MFAKFDFAADFMQYVSNAPLKNEKLPLPSQKIKKC